ncbi:MAG: SH3 domain-containing protein [Clostridiales bacterium]|nr:SH3 domain-containing protein [Clostridiales bacterium]
MKILGVKTAYRLTKQKVMTTISVVVVMGLCCVSAIAVDALLNFADVQALRVEPGDVVDYFDVIPEEYAPDRENNGIKNPIPASDTKAAQKMNSTEPTTTETSEETTTTTETEEETTEPTSETAETTEETTEPTEETTEAETEPTKNTTKAPGKVTETAFKRTVYARAIVNIRTGPGTSYKVIRKVNIWKPINVIAKTSNGWYKTADGGYVKQSLTTLTAPKPTATPKPTKAPTKKPTKATTTTKKSTIKKTNGVKCKITFYGPVLYKRKDGSTFYSTTTATGTKCKQGQTCAADWSVFPKKSWVYIENDPLGGDGLYKVEDTGRFKGNWIDIYVDSAKGHNTCYRMVYQQ